MNNILVLSREKGVIESLRLVIPEGWIVLTCNEASEALDALHSSPVDIVIIDNPVGGMDFKDFLQQAKKIRPESAVIALSAASSPDIDDPCGEANNEVVGKPFKRKQFIAALRRAEEKSAMLKELKLLHERCRRESADSRLPAPAKNVRTGESVSYAHYYYQEAIRKFSKALTYIFEPSRLLDEIVVALAEIFDLNKAAILLRDEHGPEFRVKASTGIGEKTASAIRLNAGKGIAGWLRREGRVLKRSELEIERPGPEHLLLQREMDMLGSYISLPLTARGDLVAIISAGRKITGEDITHEDVGLLATMASYAAVAIDNSLLYRKIENQENCQRSIMNSLTIGVLSVDADGLITAINRTAMNILGFEKDEVGENIQKAGSIIADIMLNSLYTGEAVHWQEIYLPGKSEGFAVSASLIRDGDESVSGCAATITDLRSLRSFSGKFKIADEESLWKSFAEAIAHEVRNPLVSISTFTQLFPEKYGDESFRTEFYRLMSRDVGRLDELLEKLERYAEPPALELQNEKLSTVVDEALSGFKKQLSAAGIKIKKEYAASDDCQLMDPDLMSEALFRLIANSIEAMPEGGLLKIVIKRNKNLDRSLMLEITDTGEGIPAANLQKIFSPFFSTRNRALGLGLPIAKKILMTHGGALDFVEGPEGGASCRIVMPDILSEKV